MNVNEFWIPVVMFIGLTVVLSLLVWFRFRAKKEVQETVRVAIEKGEGLSTELIENLVNPPVSPHRDLRRGVISVLIAIGLVAFGLILGEEDAIRPLVGSAMFPLSIGIGFLLMHRYGSRQ